MTVYIEVVLFENIVVDSVLLWLVLKTLNKKPNFKKIIISALFGAVFALLGAGVMIFGIFAVLLKLLVAFLMSVALEWNFEKIVQKFLLFLSYTFCFGGMLVCLFSFFGVPVSSCGVVASYASDVPFGAICALILAFAFMIFKFLKNLYKKQKVNKFCYDLKLVVNKKELNLKGFLDTGNVVVTKTQKPVVLLRKAQIMQCFGSNFNKFVRSCEVLKVKGLSGVKEVFAFEPEKCECNNKSQNVAVGFCENDFFGNDFDALLNLKMLEE